MLEKNGIIKKVTEPTEWVNSMAMVKKKWKYAVVHISFGL